MIMFTRIAAAFAAVGALCLVSPVSAQDAETTLRCSVPSDSPVYSREASTSLRVTTVPMIAIHRGSPVPAVMVDGWRPAPGPLATVLAALGREAGFVVVGADGLGSVVWDGHAAPLSAVVDTLTRQVGASWEFSSGVLRVSRAAPSVISGGSVRRPADRDVTLALLDTLRGYDAQRVTLDYDAISFQAAPAAMTRISSGLSSIAEVYAFDVSFMRGRPSDGRYAWSALGGSFTADGAGGRLILSDDGVSRLSSFLSSVGDIETDGLQTVAGPAGWAVIVPQSQCGHGNAELTLRPRRVGDGFAFQLTGLGAPVDVPMVQLGQTVLVVARDPVGGWIRMVSIHPRIVAVR